MKIYHGSSHKIETPVYGAGKPYNDYGRGFYCTRQRDMAMEWGVSRDGDGYANCYEMDCTGLRILDLNDDQYTILHWLSVLIENREFDIPSVLASEAKDYLLRNFHVDYAESDVIIGYRADDSYFSFAQDFINGTISVRQLGQAMYLGELGQQFVLKSPLAFERIHFVSADRAFSEEWYGKKIRRDRVARRQYFDTERNSRQKGDIFITHILDEEMKADDERLR